MKKSIFLLAAIALLFYLTSFINKKNNSCVKSQIENILEWEAKFGFSGSVLIVKDGKIIHNKGYGFANRDSWFLNSPKTIFYIASCSKPITALGVMKLVEEGKINLSDNITKYFQNVPGDKKGITVEMLLTHLSGLKHTYSCDNIYDREKAIETILENTPMVSTPGTGFNYSGDNYTLLAAIVEIASKGKFEDYISKNILTPSGINRPAFVGEMIEEQFNDMASPTGKSTYKSLKDIDATWGRKGRAGMILSVEDLYKLDEAIVNNKILRASTVSDMLAPKIIGRDGPNYGFGFSISNTIDGVKTFGHSGDDDGVGHNVDYIDFPDEKIKIFIASNSGMYSGTSWSAVISGLVRRILRPSNFTYTPNKLFYSEFETLPLGDLEKYEGVYRSEGLEYHVWINNEQKLVLSPIGSNITKTFNFSSAYLMKNELAKSILEETHNLNYGILQANCKDNVSFEKFKKIIAGFWQTAEKKNGTLEKIEILGTANIWSGNYQSDIATWYKLVFKNKTQLFRLEWDGNNKIAGIGGNRIPYPIMFTLNGIAKGEFIGFDVGNGRAIAVNFLSKDKNNKNLLEINVGEDQPLLLYNTGNMNDLPLRSAAEHLYSIITTKGTASALNEATVIKENRLGRFDVDEGELNDIGYRLLKENKINEAITIFKILVYGFPESANGFDSLGEAYLQAGNKEDALKNYEKSLELDPSNEKGKKIIERLKKSE